MGIWIYLARDASDPNGEQLALLQDSVTGTFYGTGFRDEDEAESFLSWCEDEDIDSRFLAEDWPLAVDAWRTDHELGHRDPLRCHMPYCFAIEPAGSGWGLCLHHALEREDEESHRDCPGCDDCTPAELTKKRGGVE